MDGERTVLQILHACLGKTRRHIQHLVFLLRMSTLPQKLSSPNRCFRAFSSQWERWILTFGAALADLSWKRLQQLAVGRRPDAQGPRATSCHQQWKPCRNVKSSSAFRRRRNVGSAVTLGGRLSSHEAACCKSQGIPKSSFSAQHSPKDGRSSADQPWIRIGYWEVQRAGQGMKTFRAWHLCCQEECLTVRWPRRVSHARDSARWVP